MKLLAKIGVFPTQFHKVGSFLVSKPFLSFDVFCYSALVALLVSYFELDTYLCKSKGPTLELIKMSNLSVMIW